MKLFFIDEKDIKNLERLFLNQVDNQFFILQKNQTYCDIAQYSSKYMNIHFATVPIAKLDMTKNLSLSSNNKFY